ncbi:chemotaxis response regulator protein-glutamate methylesterase [bacterium]|nr:chemotaxis response regulator protein-glutamate methylesterase [bacterium]
MDRIIRVLIVDDSAFIRRVVRAMLSRSPFIEVVGAARDGEEAMQLVEQLRPDVVTLDLNMPRVDGVEFLRQQMARRPVPVVLLSIASKSGSEVIRALEAGAVDVVQKPTALANDQVLDVAQDLIAKVKTAAGAHIRVPPKASVSHPLPFSPRRLQTDILVIGASTGGPQALRQLIPLLPGDFPIPIAIVLHMPVGFTHLFARSLNDISSLTVVEASDGEQVRAGVVIVAPAGYHLTYRRRHDGTVQSCIGLHPLATPHRPAVDVLFQSAAEVYGERVLAVVLTGMGSDGMQGSAWVKANGGRVFTESEDSCVVYGMPRSVVEAGLSDAAVPLPDMAQTIIEAL